MVKPLTDIAVPIAPTMRSQFETWAAKLGLDFTTDADGDYERGDTEQFWIVWEAAQKAAFLSSSKGKEEAPPDVHAALVWAMDEIDALSNKLCHFAYPQGMLFIDRTEQQEAYVRAVYARRVEPHQAEGWRSMDSAPKDGTHFIAHEVGDIYRCSWFEQDDGEGHFSDGWYDHNSQSFENPSLWMPLPALPSSEASS